jgi:hypothetical protein
MLSAGLRRDASPVLALAGTVVLFAALLVAHVPGLAGLELVLLAVGALLGVDAITSAGVRVPRSAPVYAAMAAAAITGLTIVLRFDDIATALVRALVAVAVVVLATVATGSDEGSRGASRAHWAMRGLVLVQAAFLIPLVLTRPARIDVVMFLGRASDALLHGANPYTVRYPDVYGPAQSALLYGPGVVGHDHLLTVGLPYPPASLLVAVPAYLLGDVRIGSVVVVLGAALLLHRRATTTTGRAVAVLLACAPGFPELAFFGWTEGPIVGLLAVAAWLAVDRRWIGAAVLLGLALASKQYFAVAAPTLWLLRPYATRGRVAAMVGAACAVTVPFVVWNPSGFWRSVVQFQLMQPFRADAVSLLTWSVNTFGWPGPALFGVLPLTAGFLVAVVAAWRLRPGLPGFLTAMALSLLATTALSKQAFLNYYYLIGCLLLLAAWTGGRGAPQPFGQERDLASSTAAAVP